MRVVLWIGSLLLAIIGAEIIARAPQAMQLRYLGTLSDIANERSATIVFPFPIDLVQELGDRLRTAPKRPD